MLYSPCWPDNRRATNMKKDPTLSKITWCSHDTWGAIKDSGKIVNIIAVIATIANIVKISRANWLIQNRGLK